MRQALYDLVSQIPVGKVATYGELGRALPNPVSGLIVGRWMASSPDGIPWWRVVAKSGELVLAKRGPVFAADQEQRLRREGIGFVDGRVDVGKHLCEPLNH